MTAPVGRGAPGEDRTAAVFAEAAGWYARLAAEDAGPGERASFEAWRRADPAHAGAWDELRRLDVTLGSTFGQRPRRLSRRQALTTGGAAAAVVGASAVMLPSRLQELTSDVATAVGERRNMVLASGVEAMLNTDSALDLAAGGADRPAELRRGEALFAVPRRGKGLTVRAGRLAVRASGATFGLRDDGGTARATVLEGVVEASAAGPPVPVAADRQAVLPAGGPLATAPVIADHVLAWRRGQLVATQSTLREVVAEIRRYQAGLVLLDPRAADRSVTAILDLDRLDTAIDALAGSLGLVATRPIPWLLTLRA